MPDFTERAPIEKGFSTVFADRVAPRLDTLEEERRALLAKGQRHLMIGFGIGVVLGLTAFLLIPNTMGAVITGLLFFAAGALGGAAARQHQARKWTGAVAEAVMPAVCDFLGDLDYDREAAARFPTDKLHGLGVVGRHNRGRFEDRIAGTYRDTAFTLVEAHLRYKTSSGSSNNSSTKTVFDGLLFRIALPEPAPTPILIARNYGETLNALAGLFTSTGRGMPRVETGHPEFERDFELHAEDPAPVPAYLPPAFLDNFVAIVRGEASSGAKGVRAAFDGDDFFLAIEHSKPFMEMARLDEPVQGVSEALHAVFEDLALVRRIIDRLRGETPSV